ncbi:MAG: signal peptidase II [Persicimonas sp.]
MKPSHKKYVLFFAVVLVGVALDQWTKMYASDRLATQRPGYVDHPIVLEVDEDDEGQTVEDFLADEFAANDADEIARIAEHHTRLEGGRVLRPDDQVEPGQKIEVANRSVTVIEDYWDFQYTQNTGAAFGLFADGDSQWRVPFFIIVSLIAVAMILYILRDGKWEQRFLIWGLSFIATGAIGNFVDRIRLGYVTDFIVWKYTDEYRWPTFNLADALISVGVALVAIELIRDTMKARKEEADDPLEEAAS